MFLFFIHDGLRRELFYTIAEKALEKNIKVLIYCFSLSELLWFKKRKNNRIQLKLVPHVVTADHESQVGNSIDVCADFLSVEAAANIYASTWRALETVQTRQADEDIIIFGGNGLHAFDKAIKNFSEQYSGFFSLFSELSNIDNRVFFDRKGSNASSDFFTLLQQGKLEFNPRIPQSFYDWKKAYCKARESNHVVKQAPQKNKINAVIHRLIGLAELVLRVPSYQQYKLISMLTKRKKVAKKIYPEEWNAWCDNVENIKNYVLFPLQVFGDSQIKLHSDVDNEQAMGIAARVAAEKNMPLIVKPHPGEPDYAALTKVIELKKKYGFLMSGQNTFKLIQGASEIIVINSTVGLEALICDKNVEFLGESFYKYMKSDVVMNYYINEWLLEMDIYNPVRMTDALFEKLMDRAKAPQL